MSVFKKVNQSKSKFQKGGFDESIVKDWQTQNEEHYNALSGYYDKINSGGYLSADDLSAYDTALKGYITTGNRLRDINKSYGKGYTADEDKKWADSLTAMQTDFDNASKYYGAFKTEQAYGDYLKGIEQNKDFDKYNFDEGALKIKDWKNIYASAKDIQTDIIERMNFLADGNAGTGITGYEDRYITEWKNNAIGGESLEEYIKRTINDRKNAITESISSTGYSTLYDLESGIGEKERYHKLAERYHEGKALRENALNAKDFELYAQKGAEIENPTYREAAGWLEAFGYHVGGKPINNKVTFIKDGYNRDSIVMGNDAELVNPNLYYMTDDEVKIYNYYLGKGDEETAEAYLKSIEESLNYRWGSEMAGNIADDGFLKMSFGFAAGVEQFGTVIKNLFSNEDYYAPTATQIAGGQIRESLGDSDFKIFGSTVGQIGYDLFNTTGNMFPSILLSYVPVVGGVLGTASMGLSAMGNAKAEMINLGYSKEQATTYGFLVGASEAGLQYLLGGISKLGGKASGKIGQTLVGKVDNAFARVSIKHGKNIYNALVNHAVKLGVNMASEGLEESLQTILEPWFKSIVTGEQYNAPNIDEVLYSGLLGAISAGVLEGVGTSIETQKYYSAGKAIQKAGAIDRLAKIGSTFSADSVAYQIAGRVNENTGAYTLGRLLYEVDATLTEQNKAEISEALIQKGMDEKTAKTHAEWLAYVVEGVEMTDEQIKLIEDNEIVSQVFYDVVVQRNTTEYQRMQAFAEKGKTAKVQGALQSTIKEGKNSKVAERTKGYKDIAIDILMEKMGISKDTGKTTEEDFAYETTEEEREDDEYMKQKSYSPLTSKGEVEQRAKKVQYYKDARESTAHKPRISTEGKSTQNGKTAEKTAKEEGFDYSANGKTVYKNKDVEIDKIDRIEDGEIFLRLESGEVVDAKDISFATEAEAFMYDMIAKLGVDAKTAEKIIALRGDTEPMLYAIESSMAYKYGKNGYTKGLGNLTNLSYEQKTALFGLGQTDAKADAEARTEASKQGVAKSAPYEFKGEKIKKNGVEYLGINPKELKGDLQKANVFGAEFLAKVSRLEIALYASEVKNGKRVVTINGRDILAPNGMFREGNKIYLDVNAGRKGEGTMLFTMSHEVGHYIRQWNANAFKELGDLLFENYEGEISVEGLINDEIEALKAQRKAEKKKMPTEAELFDIAYEEVVCNALSKIFADETTFVKLAKEVKAKNKSLWAKIGEAIKAFLKKLKDVIGIYSKYDLSIRNGAMTMNMATEVYNKLQDMYVKAFVEADENYAKQSNEVNDMVQIDTDSQSVSPKFSLRTWKESEYVKEKEESAKKIAKALNVSIDVAKAYIDDINSVAKLIADDRVRLDYEASPFGSAFVGNSEYGGSFDFTTLCKKRRIYTGTFSEIQKRLLNTALTPDDILKIRNMMIERGIEATCGLCYVEGSRANMGKFAKEFIRLYKRDNPNAWIPNMADVNTPDGVESMRINHPKAYEQYEYFWNHYGKLKDSDPALFASQQKPKLYESRKEYKGEITNLFKNDSTVEKKNLNGGIRMQSFSDFEIVHMIDTMQIIMDMSTVGLAGQAYTKVPEFAEAFGNTGLKINLSLIAKDVDSNGKLIFDDREGMPHDKAFAIRNKYSKNVGTIIVTFTDEQLLAAMSDTRIDFIIPFHRSQWKKGQYTAMGLPKGTKDYTFMQNEKLIKQTYHEYRGKMVKDKASNYMPNEYWDFSKSGKENAEAYLKMCAENNKRPKFYKLLDYNGNGEYSLKKDGSTDGYWKLLIDFKMYNNNGVGSPQVGVKPNFSMGEITRILDEYRGGHASYPIAHDVVDAFIKEYKENNNVEASELADADTHYSTRVTDKETLDFLENQEHITTYKSFVEIDGKLYSPMATKIKGDDGKYKLTNPSELGVWQQAEEKPDTIPKFHKSGYGYYVLKKDDGGTVTAAYNPYEHSSNLVLNDQFEAAYQRPNLVTVECIIPKSELTSGYKAKYAKDSTGYLDWKSGSVAGKLKGNKRKVYLSRWLKPVRVVPDSEVAKMYKDLVGAEISVPFNVVTPNLLAELEKIGVKIDYNGSAGYQYRQTKTENSNVKYSTRDSDIRYSLIEAETSAKDFVTHMKNLVKTEKKWYSRDVYEYVETHPELNFIDRIYEKDKQVKKDLTNFLDNINDVVLLDDLSWFMGGAYSSKGFANTFTYPYRGAVRTFKNAVNKRINALMTEKVNGTNLGVTNGEYSLREVKDFFEKLNGNVEIGKLAEKVFATAKHLGVNIRFINNTFASNAVGDALGDMIEYKTSYFNDTAVSDQKKASTILHELIHACTVYVMDAHQGTKDYRSDWKSDEYLRLANAAIRLNKIYEEIKGDADFAGQYGLKNAKEMVAELSNEDFVALLKKKNLWERIVDWICDLFGIRRGNSAYENAMLCLDYILDNPDYIEYTSFASNARALAEQAGIEGFGRIAYFKEDTMYSVRSDTEESNRSLLAEALESVVQNEAEAEMLSKYKATIGIMEENERMLAEKKEQLFSKGIDNETRKKLRFEINKIANNINTYDKQLYRLEANAHLKAVLEREKTKAYERAKQRGRDALKAYREQVSERFSNVIKSYQESRKKAVEGRHKTILRNQLKVVINDLRRVLEKGTKERNVKIGLQETVRKALELSEVLLSDEYTNEAIARLGVPSVTDAEQELLDKYNVLLDNIAPYKQRLEKLYEQRKKLKKEGAKQDEIDAINAKIEGIRNDAEYGKISRMISELNTDLASVFVRERNRYNKQTAQDIMQALIDAYSSLKNSQYDYIKAAYNDELNKRLEAIKKTFGNVSVKDMSLQDLQDIYKAYAMVKHVVTDANTIFRDGRKEDLGKRINTVQTELRKMQKERKDPPLWWHKITGWIRNFSWKNLRPVDAFERLGAESFKQLFWDAVKAQDTYARDIVEAGEFISEARDRHGYKKWDLKTAKTFKTANGRTLKLTLADMMSIYAYSFRDQAYDHMTNGGFVFKEGHPYKDGKTKKVHVKTTETYILSMQQIQEIVDEIEKNSEVANYVKEVQAYLTGLGAKGNEVSRILYGIDIFTEEHYFPLKSEQDYRSSVEEAFNQTQTMVSLKNTGMTKATVPHAKNPIVLQSFDDVVLEHIDKMSKYHAYVIPIENLQKVFNNSSWDGNNEPISTKALISGIFGEEATGYFNTYITDLNGGGTSVEPSLTSKFFSTAKGVAVAGNLSVVVQQYFSIARSMAEIDAKYFVGNASKADGKVYEELKKYAPVVVIKEMGGFDIGSNRGAKDYIGMENAPVDGEYVWKKFQDATMFGASLMDKAGWSTIWRAVKNEIAATRKDLKVGSEDFLKACGDRFTEVVTKTQVYDSVNTRSGFMRSKNEVTKYLTSFMGEPTAIVGMCFTAFNNLRKAIATGDKTAIKAAKKQLGKTLIPVAISGTMTAIAKALVQAMRDDDEDETYPEKWLEHFASNIRNDLNPLNYLPLFKDMVSIIEGWEVERPDMSLFSDLVGSLKKMFDGEATVDDILGGLGAFANFFGIPLKNLIRDTRGFINTINSAFNGEKTTGAGMWRSFREGIAGKEIGNTQQLYEAYMRGDKEQIKRVEGRYDKKSEAESALRQALRKNDDRIKEAAQAVINGDHAERIRLTREIVAEGHFRQDTVVSAINAEITYLRSKNK